MPRVAVVKTLPAVAGATIVTEANGDPVNGHSVAGLTEHTVITIRNADSTDPHNVTFVTTATLNGLAVADRTVAIPANGTRVFSKFERALHGRTLEINVDDSDLKIQAMEP